MLSFAILKGPISNFNLEISLGFIDNAGQLLGYLFNYGYQNWEIGSTRAIKIGKLVQTSLMMIR
jgi:hypothetical protein